MDDDLDLRNFSGFSRLFPLPNVVLLPHAVLPLHIFEPRYRQMTEDALADDQLITLVQLRPSRPKSSASSHPELPAIETVGCLGRILQHERLPDGRYNFLLVGRKRVRLHREISQSKLYRTAETEIIEDIREDSDEAPRRSDLVDGFRRAFERKHKIDGDLSAILDGELPLGILTDIVAHALGLPAEIKQYLLGEANVVSRADALSAILRQMSGDDDVREENGRAFPPPFSPN